MKFAGPLGTLYVILPNTIHAVTPVNEIAQQCIFRWLGFCFIVYENGPRFKFELFMEYDKMPILHPLLTFFIWAKVL